jgi:hypothetical protein
VIFLRELEVEKATKSKLERSLSSLKAMPPMEQWMLLMRVLRTLLVITLQSI